MVIVVLVTVVILVLGVTVRAECLQFTLNLTTVQVVAIVFIVIPASPGI